METIPPEIDTVLSDPPEAVTTSTYVSGDDAANWPTLLGMKNNTAELVEGCAPWTFKSDVPAHLAGDKEAYVKWRATGTTAHLVFSGYEGRNPGLRCSKGNPVSRMHCFVADYDSKISDKDCQSLFERCPADLRPNWISKTFAGGRRLVWMFEKPIAADHDKLRKKFLEMVKSELLLNKLLAGLDESAWADTAKYYDVGTDWQQLSGKPLPVNWLFHIMQKASEKLN
ncbi:MAG TPA: hypothetical protein VGY75_10585 [Candidatus Udaeobacter sp.]|jgi:hypothetical protein|nr:hypothetical protein [Candidatus Udaeobacter sp.]